jgi:hypothetical protein
MKEETESLKETSEGVGMTKPREFWILYIQHNDSDNEILDFEPGHYHSPHNEHIHVIEISALREAEARLKEAMELIEKLDHARKIDRMDALIEANAELDIAIAEFRKKVGEHEPSVIHDTCIHCGIKLKAKWEPAD